MEKGQVPYNAGVMAVRTPVAAGTFYPAHPGQLTRELETCLGTTREGLGPAPGPLATAVGLILPHAGYRYSGPVAALGYRALWALGRPQAVIILGTNHTGLGGPISFAGPGEWATPLGPLPVHEELTRALAAATGAERSDTPFREEHSVEVQLPFLQYLFGPIPIVPAVVRELSPEFCREVGQAMAGVVGRTPVALIASTDFSHYEPDQVAREKDRRALAHILNLDLEGFLEAVLRHRISICGVGTIGILISAARTLGLLGAELLAYRTSGEVVGMLDQVVGYAAVMFREVEEVA